MAHFIILNWFCVSCVLLRVQLAFRISCNDNYFFDENGLCKKCPEQCLFCASTQHCLSCRTGFWGKSCELPCSTCKLETSCDKKYGFCLEACRDGYTGILCDSKCQKKCLSCNRTNADHCISCPNDKYGSSCDRFCSRACYQKTCDVAKDHCTSRCTNGNWYATCKENCPEECSYSCNWQNETCTDSREDTDHKSSVADLPRMPKRRVTTNAQDNRILTAHARNRTKPAERTAAITIGIHGRPISGQTVRNRLREHGMKARRQYVGPVLTQRHRIHRRNWAHQHLGWTRQQWSRVIFSDESRFTLDNKDGRVRVYRRVGERYADVCVKQTNRYQRGIMVWVGITTTHKLALVVIRGNLNAQRYVHDVLAPVVVPFINNRQNDVIFQQDNARPHVARYTMDALQRYNVNVMEWPALSPDLSPIEHIWDELGRRIRQRLVQPETLQQLEDAVMEEWEDIPIEVAARNIHSMRRRCRAVINANGGHTRY